MGRQESPQLIERKTQVDTDAQETSRASKCIEHSYFYPRISFSYLRNEKVRQISHFLLCCTFKKHFHQKIRQHAIVIAVTILHLLMCRTFSFQFAK